MHFSFKRVFLSCALFITFLLSFMYPDTNELKRSYSYTIIGTNDILSNVCEDTVRNFTSTALTDCDYNDIVQDDSTLSLNIVNGELIDSHKIKEGGEYAPFECRPKFSTAIIVPYRDTAEQLHGFLVHMHTFLRRQKIHYRIYVVEQIDTKAFNRPKLINIGAMNAMGDGFPCLVFHDMELLPLRPSNLYVCTKLPRHMSSNINKFRFMLPYSNLFGGAISITTKQFQIANGMSNDYYGRTGEDDDFYARLKANKFNLCRFESKTSLYHMSYYQQERPRDNVDKLSDYGKDRMVTDGLNTLRYSEMITAFHPLFTHIMVDL